MKCIQDSRGWRVSPRNTPLEQRTDYGKECARASKLSTVTNKTGEKLGRYAAVFKTWQSRISALKELTVGIMFRDDGMFAKSYHSINFLQTKKS